MRLDSTRGVITAVVAYLLLRVGAQTVSVRSVPPVVLVLFSVALFMLLQLAIIRGASGLRIRPRVAGVMIPVFVLAVIGFTVLTATVRMPMVLVVVASALRDLALMFFAVSLGYALSVIVREPNILLPVSIFAAVVDFWSVNFGPLAILLARKPEVVQAAAVQMPAVGFAAPVSMIGVGDFVFLALYFTAMYRFRLNVAGAFWLGFVLLTLTMVAVIRVPWLGAVPALVPIGIAVIGANARHFTLKRQEILSIVVVGVVLLVVLTLSVVLLLRGS